MAQAVYTETAAPAPRDTRALALFAACDRWHQGHTKDGRPFFAIPGSEAGLFHMADQNDCSCPDRQQRGAVCKHMRAVRLWMAAFKTGAVAPKRATADPLEDRVVLLPKGAAALAEAPAPVAEHPFISELRGRLERRALILRAEGYAPSELRQDAEYAAVEARMLEMRGKVAAVAERRRKGYADLFPDEDA